MGLGGIAQGLTTDLRHQMVQRNVRSAGVPVPEMATPLIVRLTPALRTTAFLLFF